MGEERMSEKIRYENEIDTEQEKFVIIIPQRIIRTFYRSCKLLSQFE